MKRFALAFAAFSLAACSAAPLPTYDLTAPRDITTARPARAQLTIVEPTALETLNSARVQVRGRNDTVSYLDGAQWADRLPRLIQVRMIQTFENSSRIASVALPEARLAPGYSLASELRRFEIDAPSGEAVVSISVRLIDERTGRITAARVFEATRPANLSGAGATAALDEALGDVLREIVAWTTARV